MKSREVDSKEKEKGKRYMTAIDLLLKSQKKTRQDLANLLGMTRSNMGHHIRGVVTWKKSDLARAAEFLGVQAKDLARRNGYRVRTESDRKPRSSSSGVENIATMRADSDAVSNAKIVLKLLEEFENGYSRRMVDMRIIKVAIGVLRGKCRAEIEKVVGKEVCDRYFDPRPEQMKLGKTVTDKSGYVELLR